MFNKISPLGIYGQELTKIAQGFFDQIGKVRREADRDRGQFVYLAGIGLMTEFIFHELDRAVNHTIEYVSRSGQGAGPTGVLKDQMVTLQKRIAAFDEMTTEKRQSKSNFDVIALVRDVLDAHDKEFLRHRITVSINVPDKPFPIKAVRGMFIQILENLIVNSAYWLKRQKDYEPGFRPKISVAIDARSMQVLIEDNGPGVTNERKERIFQPFVTTKPVGLGRGLGLYIARDMAEYHGWTLAMNPELGKVRSGRTNMFILEMRNP